ncbi:MAG: hypothetical protein HOY79_04315 [Streptomyces sp.]|nr:hypothetical protein [Streptomyces sp.]NUS15429.1 hypothetical protein [Streptomyces sp.]NUS24113.1 hypothetical protein [Streptomyces sp.]
MPSDDADDQQRIVAALEQAAAGRRDRALTDVLKMAAASDRREFRLWQHLAVTALNHPAGTSGISVFKPYRHVDIADAPPAVACTIRFLAAVAARDHDLLRTHYRAAKATGTRLPVEVVGLLLDAATEASTAVQEAADRPDGTPGTGPGV